MICGEDAETHLEFSRCPFLKFLLFLLNINEEKNEYKFL